MPLPTLISDRRSRSVMAAVDRLPAGIAWTAVIVILLISAAIDGWTPSGANLAMFYGFAIVLAAWRLGRGVGYAAVAATVLLSLLSDAWHSHQLMQPGWIAGWNVLTNMVGAVMLVGLTASLRATILHERARASVDPLTGVMNRSAFFARVARGTGGAVPMLLACIDLDGFKAVNDGHGHATGDRLLVSFAAAAAAALAGDEAIARIGGDEFAMLVVPAPGEDASQRARRLHRHLCDVLACSEPRVTCSVGVAAIPPGRVADVGALLASADAALYEVKRAGRNGVRFAEDRPAAPLRLVMSGEAG